VDNKYRNKYRISSARLAGWDYGSNGMYYVTICTKDRGRYFGEIESNPVSETQSTVDASMADASMTDASIASLRPTEIGIVAFNNWQNIPDFHPYVELDDFVIMPDHIHGILCIDKPDKTIWEINKFGVQSKNLASILRGFKSSVTKHSNTNNIEFCWQPRYYDRVIRDEKEYRNIKMYIQENPYQWFLNKEDFDNLFKP
jgi:REP element-mobilizing transposase RayT